MKISELIEVLKQFDPVNITFAFYRKTSEKRNLIHVSINIDREHVSLTTDGKIFKVDLTNPADIEKLKEVLK